jgi:hypothetical protein
MEDLAVQIPIDRNFDFVADEFVKKLIMLFTFEKMEIPLTDTSIDAIVSANPSWMTYMDCKEVLFQLQESKFIYRASHGNDAVFGLTQDGRMALSNFYTKIPASIREEITDFAKINRQRFKRNQEYTYDYFKNSDGTYTVALRIKDSPSNDYLLEIRIKAATRASAVRAATQWKEKAPSIYEYIHNTMLDSE